MPIPGNEPRLMEIFSEALELTSEGERAAFLDRACAADRSLRGRVMSLLEAHIECDSFLESPAPAPTLTATPIDRIGAEAPGTSIGPYKLMELLGEGGMGIVYVADQARPVRRRVALKLVRPGMDSRAVIARFEAERQALALMDHPNIAKVLDGGTTENGRPYFVMELVRGLPITEYCDREQLSVPGRLELFVRVCRAVQHAHQKGVIHRDIKPSNILVTLHDGVPVPKVIDFGVAKAIGQPLTDKTLYTGFAQLLGTPLYMSPEQVEMSGLDVDTRSDIYSLGVLLYELLTGTTPFDAETLKQAAFDEMRRIIREQEPQKPSVRLSSLGETLATVSGRRASDPRRLNRAVRGELDWIALKALEKDRRRRYETASDLAADVIRHLTGRAVEACPPSAWYRLRTYARRNRAALTTATLVGLAMAAGTGASLWQAGVARKAQQQAANEAAIARKAQRRATAEADAARKAQSQAEAAETRAATEAAIARAVNDFLQGDLLGQAHSAPDAPREFEVDPHMSMREALDRAAARVGQRFRDQPLVEAAIRTSIGDAYRNLAVMDPAVPQFERALAIREALLGPNHPETLATIQRLAHACQWAALHEQSIALRRRLLESRIATSGPNAPETLVCVRMLAQALMFSGDAEGALRLLEEELKAESAILGPEAPQTIDTLGQLALTHRDTGRLEESTALFEKYFAAHRAQFGTDDYPISVLNGFVEVCQLAGRYDEAGRVLHDGLGHELKRADSTQHRNALANLRGFLTANLLFQGKYDEAERLAREVVDMKQYWDAKRHYWICVLGASLMAQGRYDEAEPYLVEGCENMIQIKLRHPAVRRRVGQVGAWVVQFYEETDQPMKVQAWRKRLAMWQ